MMQNRDIRRLAVAAIMLAVAGLTITAAAPATTSAV